MRINFLKQKNNTEEKEKPNKLDEVLEILLRTPPENKKK
jgi:hypothetical protein